MFILFCWFYMFIMGGLSFSLNRKHLLLMLLSLEFIVLSLFLGLFFYLSFMHYELYFSMLFISFGVCEGALGLSLLVYLIRTHGNDYVQTFSILW
uniref:NADH-ubiquinone oxidoreductase chain 4L n=1 Tax=Coleoptera sp. 10 KM-2017 TaxID=2219313 RepID=A0A346RGH0_9COLE|nr:NADH dehydrogenase subunit 4L [Coleoptera sp. 10 KM-2017]